MNRIIHVLGILAAVLTLSCKTSNEEPKNSKTSPTNPAQNNNSNNNSIGSQNPNQLPSTESGLGLVDVIMIVAIGSENTSKANNYRTNINSIQTAIQKKSAGKNIKFALMASPTASVSGVGISALAFSDKKQINYELDPAKSLLGTLIAGCPADQSSMSDPHNEGTVSICGQSAKTPSHSWTWSIEELQGSLSTFLRPNAKRHYIVISSGSPIIVDSSLFQRVSSSQASGGVSVHTVSPESTSGLCSSSNKSSQIFQQLSTQTNGIHHDFCQNSWQSFSDQVASRISGL